MKKTNTKSKKGFTIIEVVLVLAIAGLIFLMVFIALPNLQRTQRDTQRRNDLDRLSTSLTQYITNNNQLPSGTTSGGTGSGAWNNLVVSKDGLESLITGSSANSWAKFAYNYLLADNNDTFQDPNGDPYRLESVTANAEGKIGSASLDNFDGNGVMVVAPGARCGAEVDVAPFEVVNGARRYAVAMRLESNGIYCVDNS